MREGPRHRGPRFFSSPDSHRQPRIAVPRINQLGMPAHGEEGPEQGASKSDTSRSMCDRIFNLGRINL